MVEILNVNYIHATATILVSVALALIVRAMVNRLKKKRGDVKTNLDIIIAAISTPIQVTLIAVGVFIALTGFGIVPTQYAWWILDPRLITMFYIIVGAWILASFLYDIIALYGTELAKISGSEMDDRFIKLLERIVKYIVWFAALMLILSDFDVNITPFLEGAGIAGIALALAAQDILSNFLSGAIITMDKPFTVGDHIKVETFYGEVVEIGPRSTRIRTLDNQIVSIPNNKITTSIITNYSMPDPIIRIAIPISTAYGTDVDTVERVLLEIAHSAIKETGLLLAEPKPEVIFTAFGASGLKFNLSVCTRTDNGENEVKNCINRRIFKRFAVEGIDIPYQQIDIHMRN